MDYNQLEDHIRFAYHGRIYRQLSEELAYMDDGETLVLRLQYGNQQRLRDCNVGKNSRKAEMTLTHMVCNDRNQKGTGLDHLLCHERPQELYKNHNP